MSERHHWSDREKASSVIVIVSPVPVTPLTPSNRALTGDWNTSIVGVIAGVDSQLVDIPAVWATNRIGNDPYAPTSSHPMATVTMPWGLVWISGTARANAETAAHDGYRGCGEDAGHRIPLPPASGDEDWRHHE